MNNRISGDFDLTTLEAFRAAYAQREVKPEDLEVDKYTGLPTDTVANISPWIEHTGLWRANPGTDRAFIPNQVLEGEDEFDDGELSEDEFNRMVDEVLSDLEEEERFAREIYDSEDDDSEDPYDDESGSEEENSEGMDDDELEALIAEILSENEEDEPEESEIGEGKEGVEAPSEDEIERLIDEIMNEIEEDEEQQERQSQQEREVSNEELEGLIAEMEGSLESEITEDGGESSVQEGLGESDTSEENP